MTTFSFGRCAFETGNVDKVLFPDDGITKGDLIDHYAETGGAMMPHAKDRLINMHRFPDGISKEGFFHKQVQDYFPDWIQTLKVKKKEGTIEHAICSNTATLAYAASLGCITPHLWLSRTDHIDCPDWMVFDLDPPEDSTSFTPVRDAARMIRAILDEMEMACYLKTSGSQGLHLHIPLDGSAEFDPVRAVARNIAELAVRRHPDHLTLEVRKEKREGRIFVDTLRNAYAQTVVPPYAIRPLPGAPVATPIDWEELENNDLNSRTYNLKNIRRRLGQKEDPWKSMWRRARSLQSIEEKVAPLLK